MSWIMIGNTIWRRGGGAAAPVPDVLFDTRSGQNITDSLLSQSAIVNYFPALNWTQASSQYSGIYTRKDIVYTGGNFTSLLIMQPTDGYASTNALRIQPFGAAQNYYVLHSSAKSIQFYIPTSVRGNFVFPDGTNYLTNWYAIILRFDGTTCYQAVYKMGASGTKASANYAGTPSSVTGSPMFYSNIGTARFANVAMYAHWDTNLSDAEINAIVDTLTMPSTLPIIYNTWDGDENHYRYFYNAIDGTQGWIGALADPRAAVSLCDDDYTRYIKYNWGRSQLYNGYTQRGVYQIPYKPDGTKGAANHMDDIEHPSSSCIHNMTHSRIDFSGCSDVTIKAIFDKSDRTYWKASIESTSHYVDAGGGYYGLWHPSELLADFIDTHAQAGHNGHIVTSLRTSGNIVTGITAIRVYKTSLI